MSHRRLPRHSLRRRTRITALTVVVGALAVLHTAPAGADPDEESAASLAPDTSALFAQVEAAVERYNAATERAARLRRAIEHAQDRAARSQAEANRARDVLGRLAGEQYRMAGLDPSLSLLLSADPDSYLDRAAVLDRVSSLQRGQVRALRAALRVREQQRRQGVAMLAEWERQRAVLRRHKETVQRRLSTAQRLLDRVPATQRASRFGAGGLPSFVDVGDVPGRAGAAMAAAMAAVGAPYGWGQAGPDAFDCSGLTQWAYARAGVALPRTSQQQSGAGTRVPVDQARPGDLVIYRQDASHVAMYLGHGRVVHAPHPGARVRYDPIDMMPIRAVTRP